jgi:hypothetical protein
LGSVQRLAAYNGEMLLCGFYFDLNIASSYLPICLLPVTWLHILTIHSQAFRRLNAVSVPKMVGVPKNAEEDAKRGN